MNTIQEDMVWQIQELEIKLANTTYKAYYRGLRGGLVIGLFACIIMYFML